MIVGDGDEFVTAKRLVGDMGLDPHVVFTGAVAHRKLPDYINAGDILLFPTLRKEGFSLVVIDAMACAKPIIASNIGGNSEALDDGRTGILIGAGSLKETVNSLDKLLENDELAHRLGQNALVEVTRRFGMEKMIMGVERVLNACVNPDVTNDFTCKN